MEVDNVAGSPPRIVRGERPGQCCTTGAGSAGCLSDPLAVSVTVPSIAEQRRERAALAWFEPGAGRGLLAGQDKSALATAHDSRQTPHVRW
eukprot:3387530-Rhodomonas_salina.4